MGDEYATVEMWMDALRNRVGSINLLASMGLAVTEEDIRARDIAERQLSQLENLVKKQGMAVDNTQEYFRLSSLTTDEKIDLMAGKIIGDPWHNEPGIVVTLKAMLELQAKADRERKLLFVSMLILSLVQSFVLVDIYLI